MKIYDVIVVGGGAAGVGAAVGAAQTGARTLLIERGSCLGGAATLRNVTTYCGLYVCGRTDDASQVVFGVAEQVVSKLRARDAVTLPQTTHAVYITFDPEALKVALDEVVTEAGVDVMFQAELVGAVRENGVIQSITVNSFGHSFTFAAKNFVDSTGDAVLTLLAGAATRYGSNRRVQTGTLGVRYSGIPPMLDDKAMHNAVKWAKSSGMSPLTSDTGLIVRLPGSDDVVAYLVDEDVDVRDPMSLSTAIRHARAQAWTYLKVFQSLPGARHARIVTTGPELGVRETHHVLTRKSLTADDVTQGLRCADMVAVGAWPVEYHPGAGKASHWEMIGGEGYYSIPLDALKSLDTVNLFAAGRLLDGERRAAASLRVMGTSFACGQAAGVAAAHRSCGREELAEVQAELQRQGARLPL